MKKRTHYSCQQCGHISAKWVGQCPICEEWNTFIEESIDEKKSVRRKPSDSRPVRFDELDVKDAPRIPTGIIEFDRVLGGGVVPGALILLGGDPGVGKSTLMLDVAAKLATRGPVLYASGEESPRQIKLRGERLRIESQALHVYSEMSIEDIFTTAEELAVVAVVVDSIQTTFSVNLDMPPGSIGQVREVASQCLFWTKKRNVPVFLIGHITKEGSIAGPKALEHIVDTVLYFEGPRQHPHRIVRTVKNRFGPANELGIFEMGSNGLRGVENPSGLFLSDREVLDAGSAIVCCIEGSRPLLVELQALVSETHFGTPRRLTTGVDPQRLSLLAAVIEKRLEISLRSKDIYLNVVGGLEIDEPAADLAVVGAILSSYLNRPIRSSTIVFGEVGLGGEVRSCLYPEIRLKEAKALGFSEGVTPRGLNSSDLSNFDTLPVDNLAQAVEVLFGADSLVVAGGQ